MPKKRITYVPTVRTLGDLPDHRAFELGTVYWVQELKTFVYVNEMILGDGSKVTVWYPWGE